MRRRDLLACVAALATVLVAGCSQNSAPGPVADEPADGAAAQAPAWTNTSVSGVLASVDAVQARADPLAALGSGFGTEQLQVPDGAVRLLVTVGIANNAPGTAVDLHATQPSCAPMMPSCGTQLRLSTTGGQFAVAAPEAGLWRFQLWQGTAGAAAAQYTMAFAVLA